ncbi:MAG: LamG-like jellyroll fold domain-containing protein [Candidatus Paceibacterota bacterium]|jgi:prepilin-type N-terminal cleavage/methylation domain-containing protein
MNKLIKQAFTLIELLVVIAIIGILSGLIVVSMSGVTQKANIAKVQVFSNSLRNSLMANIVGEWKFDGTAIDGAIATNNDVLDTWGGLNNGSVTLPARTHTPTIRTGSKCVSGSCLEFNGSGDYVDCGYGINLNITDLITIEAWINPKSATQIYGRRYQNNLYITGTSWEFRVMDAATSSWDVVLTQSGVTFNNWYHIVVVGQNNGSNWKMYVNGEFKVPGTSVGVVSRNTSGNYFLLGGAQGDAWYGYFSGLLDDVRIYNVAISASQIKEQYYVGLNKLLNNGGITREEYLSRVLDLNNSYAKR